MTDHGRYQWYVLAILTLVQIVHSMDRFVVSLVLQPIGLEFALSDRQLGLLAGLAYGGAFAFAAIPLGLLSDRMQRRKLLAVAIAVWSGLTAVCGMASNFAMLVASRAGVGAAESVATPNSLSLLGDYFPPSKRTTAIGVWYMGAGLGVVVALLGGGYVVQQFGWRAGFVAAGLPGFLLAILVWSTIAEPVRGATDIKPALAQPVSFRKRVSMILSAPGLLHCMAGIILTATAISGFSSWVVTFLIRAHGLNVAQAGLTVALGVGLLSALGSGVIGIVIDRIGLRRGGFDPKLSAAAAAFTCLATAALAAAAVLATSPPAAIALLLAAGLFLSAYNGPANGLFVTLTPAPVRGLSISMLQFGTNLVGMGIGPLIVGAISDKLGPNNGLRWGLLAVLLFNLWAAAHFLILSRRRWRTDGFESAAPQAAIPEVSELRI